MSQAERSVAASTGDASFEEFVAGSSAHLFTLARLLTGGHRAEAEDLLQGAYERTYRHWKRVCRREDPERYVRQILLPYAFTHYQPGTPPWPVAVRTLGIALIAAGGLVVITGFARFATEGVGIPVPTEPTSQQLTTGGPYRYVRNPLYLAIVITITGQALLLSRPILLSYAAVMLATFAAFVHWYEEPTLARRFGPAYQAYRKQVPAWWPRLPRRIT